jgi:16S rRNA (guanine(966)-N(2))-methyltransferase RsmD
MMRVIAGEFRTRVLKEVDELSTRETKDRVKESIFNSITPYLYDANVLDLFAGSGSLGIEAISRGSKYCEFVDLNMKACKVVKENVKSLDIIKQVKITNANYKEYLLACDTVFDVILLDPPYALEVLDEIIEIIQDKKLLDKDGIIVCLYGKNSSLKEDYNGIIEYKQKKIGITKVSFMKWGI